MTALRLTVGGRELTAEWAGTNPRTRTAIADALPISGTATRWGDELYFDTDIDVPPENTQTEVPVGAVAYWPQGNAICLFWGATPASQNGEPRAAAPVSVVARIQDVSPLVGIQGGAEVRIEE